MSAPVLEACSVGMSFPGVRALHDVSFSIRAGEVHALAGENGAGKSTLIKVLTGVYPAGTFTGGLRTHGQPTAFRGIASAREHGIAVVHQELSLVPEMTVAENIFLGTEPRTKGWLGKLGRVDFAQLHHVAALRLAELNLDLDPMTPVARLSVGCQQMVEIAKSLSPGTRVLVLDEPTAALTETEAESLFKIVLRLKAKGVGILYVSHRLGEIFRLADRITVLRDGQIVDGDSFEKAELDEPRLISKMVGREVSRLYPTRRGQPGEPALEVSNLGVADPARPGRYRLRDISFSVRYGEILGIGGLMGAGRTELLMALFGAADGKVSGEIRIGGAIARFKSPRDAIAQGLALVTEDRKHSGLCLEQSITGNLVLSALPRICRGLVRNGDAETSVARQIGKRLGVRATSYEVPVGTLSGGNQQKVVLGKWLLTEPRILLLDEPTRGVDVGAKEEIYRVIQALADDGLAVVMVSSEMPELLGISDRILVLCEGVRTGEFDRATATPERIMACATDRSGSAMKGLNL